MGFARRRHGWGYQNIAPAAKAKHGQSIKDISSVKARSPATHIHPASIFKFFRPFDMFRFRELGDNSAQGTAETAGQSAAVHAVRARLTPGVRLFSWWVPTKWPSGFRSIRKSEGGPDVI